MIWEGCWDGLWTLSFGLSKFHGHGSWLVCEVAFSVANTNLCHYTCKSRDLETFVMFRHRRLNLIINIILKLNIFLFFYVFSLSMFYSILLYFMNIQIILFFSDFDNQCDP